MRHFTLVSGLAFALAATFAMAPAMAEMGGPMKDSNGMCRMRPTNDQNGSYYYMAKCPAPAAATATHPVHHHKKG